MESFKVYKVYHLDFKTGSCLKSTSGLPEEKFLFEVVRRMVDTIMRYTRLITLIFIWIVWGTQGLPP